ncbi:MAG: hypothetical protein Q4F29_13975 [Lachnospiraceae bacterium]|nr:hypothetical protein [Lachnospiraceae bacterium]
MNDRLRKKRESQKRKDIHKILDLVLDINGMQASQQKVTGNHPTAFLDFAGHIGILTIDVRKNGWCPGQGYGERVEVDVRSRPFSCYCPAELAVEKLMKLKRELA